MSAATLSYDDIVWACTNLCDLLEYENEALANHDSRTVRDLADNKAALARIYEQSVAPMADEPELVETLEPDQREELLALGMRLKGLVEENARRIKAGMDACQMFMDVVVNAVKSANTSKVTYGPEGCFRSPGSGDGNSITYNKTL